MARPSLSCQYTDVNGTDLMLELRPCCEHCACDLAPGATNARICSYECTFCSHCAEQLLQNVCPNCGGGFTPRPIRPKHNYKNGNHLERHPATTIRTHHPVNIDEHARFATAIAPVSPAER